MPEQSFPFIFIHLNQSCDFISLFNSLVKLGGRPVAFLSAEPVRTENEFIRSVPVVPFSGNNFQEALGNLLFDSEKNTGIESFFVICSDDAVISDSELNEQLASARKNPQAFYLLEILTTQESVEDNGIVRMIQWIRRKLEGPKASLWIIPPQAITSANPYSEDKKFSLFPWLLKCERQGIPIFLTRANRKNDGDVAVNSLRRINLLFYTLNTFLRYSGSSVLSFLVDNTVFFLGIQIGFGNLLALVTGRVASLLVNYFLLKSVVFKPKNEKNRSFAKYVGLVIFSGSVVWSLITIGEKIIPIHPIFLKLAAELGMFFFNYYVSKTFIFN